MIRTLFGFAILAPLLLTVGCRPAPHGDGHDRGSTQAPREPEKGPHGGRLLRDGALALEVTIFERGVPPEYRVYAYDGDELPDAAGVRLTITLRRFGGRVDTIRFTKRDDYLVGDAVVAEPHSFDVEVVAEHGGRTSRWAYDSYEGRTEISPAAIASTGIELETIGPATIRARIHAAGRIAANGDRVAHVTPRYAGLVRALRANLGDSVAAGQTLAVVESNQSLQAYEVKAPIGGTIVAKAVVGGEIAREDDAMFTIADLGTLWVDLRLSPSDTERIRVGQTVTIAGTQNDRTVTGHLIYVAPLGVAETQTRLVRAEIANADGQWAPGLYVTAEIVVAEDAVPTAVKAAALQTFRDWDVVFLNDGSVFQAMPVELGRRDADWAEVVAGVTAGQRYATENSFIVKADIGKSGASHDH